MERSILIRAAAGAVLIGAGLALMLSATSKLNAMHEVTPEQTAEEVALAGAEMMQQEAGEVD